VVDIIDETCATLDRKEPPSPGGVPFLQTIPPSELGQIYLVNCDEKKREGKLREKNCTEIEK